MSNKSTINKYLKDVPKQYLVRNYGQVAQISVGLQRYFSEDWGTNFNFRYVEESLHDRLIKCDENGDLLFHLRVFDKDFDGMRCLGIGGVFKYQESVSPHDVVEVFKILINNRRPENKIGFGMCPEWLARFYSKFVFPNGKYVPYNDDLVLYYWSDPGFVVTDEIVDKMKHFDLF